MATDALPTAVEVTDSSVGTTATEIHPAGNGTTQITVINDHGSATLYVGWDSTLTSSPATRFIGGALAAGTSLTLTNYRGALWLGGSGAATDYRVERRYVFRAVSGS